MQSRKLATSVGLSALALLIIGLVIALNRRPKVSGYVDPPTLIFAYTPVEDPAVYAKVWDGFLQHLKTVLANVCSSSLFRATQPNSRRCVQAVCMSQDSTPAQLLLPLPVLASSRLQ